MKKLTMNRRTFLRAALFGGVALAAGVAVPKVLSPPLPDDGTAATYYGARKEKILADFDGLMASIQPVLAGRTDAGFAAEVMTRSRTELEQLIPQLPYIGGDGNELTSNLVQSTGALALYRVMKARGHSVKEAGQVLYEGFTAYMGLTPGVVVGVYDVLQSLQLGVDENRSAAEVSQQRKYPEDWVFNFVQGDGEAFDWGVDYIECGVCKFFHAQGADELTPYLCQLDFPMSQAFNMGLARTTTLAQGGDRCDFRYKHGRETPSGWPPPFETEG